MTILWFVNKLVPSSLSLLCDFWLDEFLSQGCLGFFQCFAYIYFTVNLLNASSIWLGIWASFIISETILNDPIHEHSIFANFFRSLNYITVNFLPQIFISTIILQAYISFVWKALCFCFQFWVLFYLGIEPYVLWLYFSRCEKNHLISLLFSWQSH